MICDLLTPPLPQSVTPPSLPPPSADELGGESLEHVQEEEQVR